MSQEDIRVLLGLVRAGLDDPPEPEIRARDLPSADWSIITASARHHRLTNLLFEGIEKLGWEASVPVPTFDSLRSAYYTNLARTIVLFDHAEALIEAARQQKPPLLLLKGAAFAGWLYSNPALRPMTDLDILVRTKDLDTMVQLAQELGYEWHERTDHAVSLRHSRSVTHLELHTSLTSCPGYLGTEAENFLEDSVSTVFWAEPARTLAAEDHLLHLCLHGAFQHGFRQPAVNACDVYLLSRLPELDWDKFLRISSRPRLAPIVYGGMALSYHVFPTEKGRLALEALASHIPRWQQKWADGLEPSTLLDPSPERVTGSPWRRILWTPSLRDSLELARETLRPHEADTLSHRWPTLRRVLALTSRHILTPWHRILFRPPVKAVRS